MATPRNSMPTPAQGLDEGLTQSIFLPWAVDLVQRANLKPGERVLDLACGTGIVARLAHAIVPGLKIVGIDINEDLLLIAQQWSGIHWKKLDAKELPSLINDEDLFHVVLCQQGLQFFPNEVKLIPSVLSPNGRIIASTWQRIEHTPGWQALRDCRDTDTEKRSMERAYDLDTQKKLLSLLEISGFQDIHIEEVEMTHRFDSTEAFVFQWTKGAFSMAQKDTTHRKAFMARAAAKLRELLGDKTPVSLPMAAYVVTARTR